MKYALIFFILISNLFASDLLSGVPGGDFSTPYFSEGQRVETDNPINAGNHGIWDSDYTTEASGFPHLADVKIINGEAVLSQSWYPRLSQLSYHNYTLTEANSAWRISAKIRGTYTRHYRYDRFEIFGDNNTILFSMVVRGQKGGNQYIPRSEIQWTAGDQNGTVYDLEDISKFFKNISIDYNPNTGLAHGKLGNTIIFDTQTQTGLQVQRVRFTNQTTSSIWDPGDLIIDEVKAEAINSEYILHGVPEGNFEIASTLIPNLPQNTTFGYWTKHEGGDTPESGTVTVKTVKQGSNTLVELQQKWYPRLAALYYNDYNTYKDSAWSVSADLKATRMNATHTDRFLLKAASNEIPFELAFQGNKLLWKAGEKSGEISGHGITENFQEYAIQYSPFTGIFKILKNKKTILSKLTNIDLEINKIEFHNQTTDGQYDPSSLFVDNVKSTTLQSSDMSYRSVNSNWLDQREINTIKSKYPNANQIRYALSPSRGFIANYGDGNGIVTTRAKYEPGVNSIEATDPTSHLDNCPCSPGDVPNRKIWLDKRLEELGKQLDLAFANDFAVVINLHEMPVAGEFASDMYTLDFWSSTSAKAEFEEIWRRISIITKSKQYPIWLELFNEPSEPYSSIPKKWFYDWPQAAINTIRNTAQDQIHPIVMSHGPKSEFYALRCYYTKKEGDAKPCNFDETWQLPTDGYKNIIWSFHQWKNTELWGDNCTAPYSKSHFETLQNSLIDISGFQNFMRNEHNIDPLIWVGEFGMQCTTPSYSYDGFIESKQKYIADQVNLWEKRGYWWSFWQFEDEEGPVVNTVNSALGLNNTPPIGNQLPTEAGSSPPLYAAELSSPEIFTSVSNIPQLELLSNQQEDEIQVSFVGSSWIELPLTTAAGPYFANEVNNTGKISIDVHIPESLPDAEYLGNIQIFVESPTAGVYNEYLAQIELMNLARGKTHRLSATLLATHIALLQNNNDLKLKVVFSGSTGLQFTFKNIYLYIDQ